MASFLPDEIVLLIFETLARPHWDREGYSERQGTLSRLALVCRRFRRLAEPLLWRQLRFDNWQGSTLRKVQRLLPKFGQHVRAMKANTRYRTYDDEQISTQQVAEVVRMSTALTEVRVMLNVRSKNDGLFKRLAGLTRLTSLEVVSVDINEPMCSYATIIFPSLVELHLRGLIFEYNYPAVLHWLSATTFPALRALFLCFEEPRMVDVCDFSPFIRQLDCVESQWYKRVWFTDPPVPPILRQVAFNDVAFRAKALSNHTRLLLNPELVESINAETGGDIVYITTYPTRKWKSSLDHICDLLGDGQLPQVHSFFIPSKVRDTLSSSGPEYATALDNFLRACESAGVEVRWLADEAEHKLVCREFWAYSRERAARRSQEQQEEQVDTIA